MAFHVVTNRCFLACEKVTSVVIEELVPDKPTPKRKRKKNKNYTEKKNISVGVLEKIPKQFSITISYYPLTSVNSPGRSDATEYTLEMRVLGQKAAMTLYAEIIKEVQEQHPGEGYLDKLVTKMLEGINLQIDEPQANHD